MGDGTAKVVGLSLAQQIESLVWVALSGYFLGSFVNPAIPSRLLD